MNRFNYLFYMCTIAMIACTPAYASYGGQVGYGGGIGAAGIASANDAALSGLIQGIGSFNAGQGPVEGDGNGVPTPCDKTSPVQTIPYAVPERPNTLSSSITYPQNKGEILIHRPAAIIVKRPPTKVVVNHPPLVVKPAPVVLHKPPAVVLRKVYVKHHPRPVKVEPVYVNVVKPPAEKYFVNDKKSAAAQAGAGQAQSANIDLSASGLASGNAGADSAAANAGYQLLQGNQGLAALAGITQGSYGGAAPSGYAPAPPSGYAQAQPSYVQAPSPY